MNQPTNQQLPGLLPGHRQLSHHPSHENQQPTNQQPRREAPLTNNRRAEGPTNWRGVSPDKPTTKVAKPRISIFFPGILKFQSGLLLLNLLH